MEIPATVKNGSSDEGNGAMINGSNVPKTAEGQIISQDETLAETDIELDAEKMTASSAAVAPAVTEPELTGE